MLIGTIELYILILVFLTFSQGHRSARQQKTLWRLSWKVFNGFGGNLVYRGDLCSRDLIYSIFKGENPTYVILLKGL